MSGEATEAAGGDEARSRERRLGRDFLAECLRARYPVDLVAALPPELRERYLTFRDEHGRPAGRVYLELHVEGALARFPGNTSQTFDSQVSRPTTVQLQRKRHILHAGFSWGVLRPGRLASFTLDLETARDEAPFQRGRYPTARWPRPGAELSLLFGVYPTVPGHAVELQKGNTKGSAYPSEFELHGVVLDAEQRLVGLAAEFNFVSGGSSARGALISLP